MASLFKIAHPREIITCSEKEREAAFSTQVAFAPAARWIPDHALDCSSDFEKKEVEIQPQRTLNLTLTRGLHASLPPLHVAMFIPVENRCGSKHKPRELLPTHECYLLYISPCKEVKKKKRFSSRSEIEMSARSNAWLDIDEHSVWAARGFVERL